MIYYAGIGSRDTPSEVLVKMKQVGKVCAMMGFTLRSGAAKGADTAFEEGCDSVQGTKEIYLPYKGFRGHPSDLHTVTKEARMFTKDFHPNWPVLGCVGRDFMGRNAYQCLGLDLNTPSSFIVCWTSGGIVEGGTGQALRIAKAKEIPVFNFGNMSDEDISDAILAFEKETT